MWVFLLLLQLGLPLPVVPSLVCYTGRSWARIWLDVRFCDGIIERGEGSHRQISRMRSRDAMSPRTRVGHGARE
jgi:hypothetical protein